jgi:hypothetical protein
MPKTATNWSSNPAKEIPLVAYSGSTVTFNSLVTKYSAVNVTLDTYGKLPSSWAATAKNPVDWDYNPDYDNNEWPYDSVLLYDSATRTYDGVTTGESPISQKNPTSWSAS